MKDRLIQLLDLEQLTPSKFADIIGVQRSSISHVISGRNNPSFDFLQKTLKAFPGLNASWLILGEGTMYERMGRNISGNLFESQEDIQEEPVIQPGLEEGTGNRDAFTSEELTGTEKNEIYQDQHSGIPGEGEQEPDIPLQRAPGKAETNKIVQVMVIYDDDTFRSYKPAQ